MEKHFFKRILKKVNACISPNKRQTSVTSVVINSLDNSLSYKHICFLKTLPRTDLCVFIDFSSLKHGIF